MSKKTKAQAEDDAVMEQAQAETLARDEAAADAYGEEMTAEEPEPPAAAPVEPARFRTGGATADEIAAWRAANTP